VPSFCKFKCASDAYVMNYSCGTTCVEIALEPENLLFVQMLIKYIANGISKAEAWKH